jgi:hypothetical protein
MDPQKGRMSLLQLAQAMGFTSPHSCAVLKAVPDGTCLFEEISDNYTGNSKFESRKIARVQRADCRGAIMPRPAIDRPSSELSDLFGIWMNSRATPLPSVWSETHEKSPVHRAHSRRRNVHIILFKTPSDHTTRWHGSHRNRCAGIVSNSVVKPHR